jgi:hypothetical protein
VFMAPWSSPPRCLAVEFFSNRNLAKDFDSGLAPAMANYRA